MCSTVYATAGLALVATGVPALASMQSEAIVSETTALRTLPETLASVQTPVIKEPGWLTEQKAAEAAARQAQVKVVTYDVATRGAITANLAEFKAQANATLNDGRGWARMGVSFTEVASGGMFTLVLSEAGYLPTFSPGCGVEYSCRAGRYVIINQDRWLMATPSWQSGGGSLRDYRHMVVNHETGHWLGHDHESCSGPGNPAAVMQQQSISLQGCTFNPWPLASELWSTQLGIKR